jgi:hypothetical protein
MLGGALGYFALFKHVFVYHRELADKPFLAVACGIGFIAIPGAAGTGLRLATDHTQLPKPIGSFLFDLISFTQYLTVAIILLAVQFL